MHGDHVHNPGRLVVEECECHAAPRAETEVRSSTGVECRLDWTDCWEGGVDGLLCFPRPYEGEGEGEGAGEDVERACRCRGLLALGPMTVCICWQLPDCRDLFGGRWSDIDRDLCLRFRVG